jgi:phage terminase Nu1 subunit (DNA packaging protein)
MKCNLETLSELTGVKAETIARRLRARGLKPESTDGRSKFYESRVALPVALGMGGPGAARERLDAARADLAELALRHRRGELLEVADAIDTWSSHTLSWKERIRSVPAEATVHIAGFSPSMGRDLLRLIDQTLVEIADGRVAPRSAQRRIARGR